MSKQFNEHTTALEVVDGVDLKGYEVIVTGGSSGIGVETVRALAKAGARCVLCCRDISKGQIVADEIIASTGNDLVEVENLELDSLDNVNRFVERYLAKNRPLHILVNNAGIMAYPLSYTVNGFESQFGVNHLGHFALTIGLLPALKEGAKALNKNSRVINVSATLHVLSNIDFDDINYLKGRVYDPINAYGQSKTCNCLFSVALTKRYKDSGIVSNSLMPGVIMTNLAKHLSKETWIEKGWMNSDGTPRVKLRSAEAGASTTVWAAVSNELEGKGGLYLENCAIGKELSTAEEVLSNTLGYLSFIMDEDAADKLWVVSEEYIKNKSP
ncbi:uncharacterized protein LOC100215504 [Hydra vulgaris]|uniref:uncharacterized protein LOC100215504 n=1 Tax=Hydra vulgaris TaxID=6087 RepID=UPI0001923A07|nr:short-chain dehydrogenase TIC 32, chloroplastic [Hydra vulgaris]